jgi:hypothetical protein
MGYGTGTHTAWFTGLYRGWRLSTYSMCTGTVYCISPWKLVAPPFYYVEKSDENYAALPPPSSQHCVFLRDTVVLRHFEALFMILSHYSHIAT